MGWTLVTSAQGKGYATEALRAALAWGKDRLPGGSTVCIISPDNQPSLALARKVGFSESHRSEYHHSPIVVMRCPL
jgi:RimJ/RimL family protein N-acetyltransferase